MANQNGQILGVQSVVIMLPSINTALDIPSSRQQLVSSIYNVSSASTILFCSRLADIHGRRFIFWLALEYSPLQTYAYLFHLTRSASMPFVSLRVLVVLQQNLLRWVL